MTDRSRPGAALILAAGEGTRMRSAVPKVLHPIGGRSLLGHAVHAVAELDPEQLVVVLGHGGEQVQEAVTALGDELARPVTVAVRRSETLCRSPRHHPRLLALSGQATPNG